MIISKPIRRIGVVAVLLAPVVAHAADPIFYSYGPNSSGIPQFIPVTPTSDPTKPIVPFANLLRTYARPAITAIPVSTSGPVNVFAAGSIASGCEMQNTGTTTLYVSLVGPATASDQAVPAGVSYICKAGTATALSVLNSSTSTAGTVAGQSF